MGHLWRVGFTPNAFCRINALSGLVEVLDTYWHRNDGALVFLVRSKSPQLFKQDSLIATAARKAEMSNQPLFVDLTGLDETCQVQ